MSKYHDELFVDAKTGNCLVCDAPLSETSWSWNLLHGEATFSCCGTSYQLKRLYIENPDEEDTEFLIKLDDGFYYCQIRPEYLPICREVYAELGRIDSKEAVNKIIAIGKERGITND